jgi:hypothetical protein
MQHDPLAWWKTEMAPVAPVGHALRQYLSKDWTRFHSLPESKRYAESEADRVVLRNRHITIATLLFVTGEPIYIYRSHFSEKRQRGKSKHQLAGRQLRDSFLRLPVRIESSNETEDETLFVRALVSRWQPDFFAPLLDQVADFMESGVAFVSPRSRNIYCPYDGGMDVFSCTIAPQELASRFSEWQSTRQDRM